MIRLKNLLYEQILGMLSTKPIAPRFNLAKGTASAKMPRVIDDPLSDPDLDHETPFRAVYNQAKKLNKPATKYSDKQAKLLRDQITGNLFDTYILSILKTVRTIDEFSALIKSYSINYNESLIGEFSGRLQPTWSELLNAISNMKGAESVLPVKPIGIDAINKPNNES